jgi:hypothetical protein
MSKSVHPLLREYEVPAAHILTAFEVLCQKSRRDDATKARLLNEVDGLKRRLAKAAGRRAS